MNTEGADILLVDDCQEDIDLTVHALRRENLANKIKVVYDGEEALDYVFCRNAFTGRHGEAAPRLILLDLKLPKVNGIEVLREVKSNPETRQIPVVIMTSSKEERDLVTSYNLGANSFIQKPVDFDAFRSTVKSLGMYWLLVNQPPMQNGHAAAPKKGA